MPASPHQQSQRWVNRSSTSFQQVQKQLKYVDLVIEVRDARAPVASGHPESGKLFGLKPRIIVLAKADLADSQSERLWQDEMASASAQKCLSLSLKTQKGQDKLVEAILALTAPEQGRLQKKGLLARPSRVCVVGIPNVGKSSLINWLIGKRRVRVGDRPGITKGPQWIRVHPKIELLDTPGVLPPTQFTSEVLFKLALLNLVSPGTYDQEEVASKGLKLLTELYKEEMAVQLKTTNLVDMNLESFGRARNYLKAGGGVDITRAAVAFLTELRSGKLGKIMLDR